MAMLAEVILFHPHLPLQPLARVCLSPKYFLGRVENGAVKLSPSVIPRFTTEGHVSVDFFYQIL